MKKLVMAAAATAFALSAAPAFANCDEGEIVIKFSHVTAATGHPKGEAAALLAKRVNEEMNGKACMEVFPNSQLFNDDKVLEALLLGDVQMAAPSLAKFERFTKKFRIFDLPFLFKDINAVDRFQTSADGQKLLDSMQRKGLQGLGYWHNGIKHFSAGKPLLLPTDAAGMKFRVQTSEVAVAMIEALDANPQKLAFAEVYGALQTGVVDGQENTWSNIYTKKFFEVQDGVTVTNHQVLDYLVVTSVEWWDGLDEGIRTQLKTIMDEVAATRNAMSTEINEQNRAKIAEAGSVIRELTPEQRQAWVDAMNPVWDQFKDDIGQDLIDAALSANN
ncbi:DctP family TRAP transporter solute-binding subunit [Cohaesibacter celericrescens]|uniref:C4-dicarboxylate ABC transporter n=1 Tax=Cohaesibacter celericrescens TaxID=2067669 RepID=A0A2N5XLE4_9HYPH|nr:DctP family TRAP transporter solute-binding subunit [Cohaesibacter celericrescens]PLW75285.1 C4-dicarboxylate ABC transporter [Cohaesibacter celericrescens]